MLKALGFLAGMLLGGGFGVAYASRRSVDALRQFGVPDGSQESLFVTFLWTLTAIGIVASALVTVERRSKPLLSCYLCGMLSFFPMAAVPTGVSTDLSDTRGTDLLDTRGTVERFGDLLTYVRVNNPGTVVISLMTLIVGVVLWFRRSARSMRPGSRAVGIVTAVLTLLPLAQATASDTLTPCLEVGVSTTSPVDSPLRESESMGRGVGLSGPACL